MPISKGGPWGDPVGRDPDIVITRSDAELARHARESTHAAVGVAGGDFFRTVGEPGPRDDMVRVPVDIIELAIDSGVRYAIAHVLFRRHLWRGRAIAVCNVSQMGEWNIAPRAHPNDGLIDIVEIAASMGWRDRFAARRRAASGSHLPHPDIDYRRVEGDEWHFDSPMRVFVDGVDVGSTKAAMVRVKPDAVRVDF